MLGIAGRFIFIVTLAAVLAQAPSPAAAQNKGDRATLVGVDAVRMETSGQTTPVIGRLVPKESGTVAAKSKGSLQEFTVDVGDRVEAGDVLARLDTETLTLQRDLMQAALNEARARLDEAQAQVQLSQNALKRQEGLRSSSAFNQASFEDRRTEVARAKSAVAVARAAVERARANLKLAQLDLDNAEIKAPYPGVVTARVGEVGAYLNIGSPVVSLVNHRNLEIEADVPSSRIGGLEAGLHVDVALSTGRTIPATLRAVVPAENARTRTRLVRFTPDFELLPEAALNDLAANQSVTVMLPIGGGKAMLTVAKDALLRRRGQDIVFAVIDGAAQPRPVQIGAAVGNRFQVIEGLANGDVVIVRGNERLRPGQKVAPAETP